MVDLRVVAGSQLFKDLPSHRVVLHRACDCLQLLGAGVDTVWVRAARSKLELWLPAKKVLGSWYLVALIHTRNLQHPHRCDLHGCAAHLLVTSSAVAENTMGHTRGLPAQYSVSTFCIFTGRFVRS